MRLLNTLALASALATATLSMVVATPAIAKDKKEQKGDAPKLKNSKKFVDAYLVVDGLIKGGDIAGAKAAAELAVAAIENDDDRLIAGQMLLNIAEKTQPIDIALALRGYDLLLASTSLAASDRPNIAYNAGRMAYNLKDYPKVLTYFDMAKAAGYSSPDMFALESHSRLNLDDVTGYDVMRTAVAGKVAAGEKASESWYTLALRAALRMDNTAELLYWSKEFARYYPTKENWRMALGLYDERATIPQDILVDLYRLRRETGSLTSEQDYANYLSSVSVNGLIVLPREALDTMQEGADAGVISLASGMFKEMTDDAKSALADDTAHAAAREQKARSGNNAVSLMSAADVALSYGRYDNAIELYDLAAAAGADVNVVNLRKGIAHYEMGNKEAAKAAFSAVKGGAHAEVAGYWLVFIEQ